MAQRIFQSFRRLPAHLASLRKKQETSEVRGSLFKINVCCDYGFPSKPTSIAYDPILDLLALLTRDGRIFVFGKPGVLFTANHDSADEFIQLIFINGTRKFITLTGTDDIYLWELSSNPNGSARLTQVDRLCNATSKLSTVIVNDVDTSDGRASEDNPNSHITSVCAASDGRCFLIGTDHGWVASIRFNSSPKHPGSAKGRVTLSLPTVNDAITPGRVLSSMPTGRQLRLDAVVVLSERPGFPGQLLIGYNSGLTIIFDLRTDRVVALLPWQHGLESATWCGGSGLPNRTPDTVPLHLGTRLLTAHSDGSLGVWDLRETLGAGIPSTPAEPRVLTMEEPPTMPYGPFPCKLISKVFWLFSPSGGITAFVGGMPRSTYGERHTVSLLRGSNLDRAAVASVVAARVAAAMELDDDDADDVAMNSGNLTALTPIHVFDPDAPEHVCFDLPSKLVDLLPVGPVGGPAQMLLLLCEEELIAVDLLTPGWPFMRPPYLASLHPAAISTYELITQVNTEMLSRLETAGAHFGPEGRYGRGHIISSDANTAGWSDRPWPIHGGQALVSGSRLSTGSLDESLLFTDDLLITGHEDGTVIFWRLSPGGCTRRIYTLHSAVLFEGEFGISNHGRDLDEDTDSWPPFRQAGLFDPFMDDSRAAVQLIRLVDNTLVVGGAAGQITAWQFLDYAPPLNPVCITIKTELPGFRWKGHAPMKVRPEVTSGFAPVAQSTRKPPPELQAVAVILTQPPARCTAVNLTELRPIQSSTGPISHASFGVLLTLGTPHGYGVVYIPAPRPPPSDTTVSWALDPPQTLISETTLPDNLDALQEAAAGEGWARRRTRELKKSLRDSFRRLKRMRSTKQTTVLNEVSSMSRAGIRRTVTQNHRPVGRHTDTGPLEEAELRAKGISPAEAGPAPPMGIEREICERPVESASAAVVSQFAFGPPLFRFSPSFATQAVSQPIGSLFVGTKAGIVKAYAVFADESLNSSTKIPSVFRLQLAKQLILQHRAPILLLRLVDTKLFSPLSPSAVHLRSNDSSAATPSLLVVSEEQVRIFALPSLRLRYKARITAKDGYRIKTGSLISFRPHGKVQLPTDRIPGDSASGDLNHSVTSVPSTPNHQSVEIGDTQGSEFAFVFTNVGGQAVILSMPTLSRRDTLTLLDSNDVVAINSVSFSQPGTSGSTGQSSVIGPSLGVYQLAPGQLTLFDVIRTGQRTSLLGASYRPIQRLPEVVSSGQLSKNATSRNPASNGSTTDSSGFVSLTAGDRRCTAQSSAANSMSGCFSSHSGIPGNSSMMSDTHSDSVREGLSPSSGYSVNARQRIT